MSSISKIAKRKYIEYSKYEGSQHIAKEHSIYRILECIKNNKCESVLEVGLGIGTIFSAVYEFNPNLKYVGTENNDFCLNSLKTNLKDSYNHLEIHANIEAIPKTEKFDVVIIDGKDDTLNVVKYYLKEDSIIVIEGDRSDQEATMVKMFPNCINVHIVTLKKNPADGFFDVKDYQGGVKVIFIKPNTKQYLYWLKHKVLTNLKYKVRILKKKV
ncbi:methyltransferase [Lacinutrix sp. MedPE-SW]|uniref:methyltransferase n=1 Tax=Lacinutrix sp. MedPE-SW TaxID=1860087 RepID=UPI0009236CDB|nr:methyltransferase [Lacinutrix sp. MedPE-SW]OIQ22717.1 MAG: hypothetical protein BM549_06455 [Lacinutrix sp. MedPE-SW]